MKKQLLTFAICLYSISSFATDLYVNSSGLPSTYATIQLAIDAASDDDNIYVSATETHNGPVTVDKSVYIVSDQSGLKFQLVGDVIIGSNVEQVTIVGANGISVTSEDNAGSRVEVNLISCSISALNIVHNNYKVNIYDCYVGGTAIFNNGIIIGSELQNISIGNEVGVSVDTIKIIANEFQNFTCETEIHNIEIHNNYVKKIEHGSSDDQMGLYFTSTPSNQSRYATIANNTIEYVNFWGLYSSSSSYTFNVLGAINYSGIYFASAPASFAGLTIVNNYIENKYSSSAHSLDQSATNSNNGQAIHISDDFPNVYLANNKWFKGYITNLTSNNSNHYLSDNIYEQCFYSDTTGNLTSNFTDLGLDQAPFFDTDGTLNDIGNSGGPHAWSNYHTSGGKAVIFELDIPTQIYIGTSQSIKAKAVHKN